MIRKGDLVKIKRPNKKAIIQVVREASRDYIVTKSGIFSKNLVIECITPSKKFMRMGALLSWLGLAVAILAVSEIVWIMVDTDLSTFDMSLLSFILGVLIVLTLRAAKNLKDMIRWQRK